MTLLLNRGTEPKNLSIKTFGLGFGNLDNTVFLGEYKISMEDFLFAAEYVLTNTNLGPNDPRIQFVTSVMSMIKVEGYNGPGTRRFKPLVPMSFSKYAEPKAKRIRPVAVPNGKAPDDVRKEWVGAKMPLLPDQDGETYYKVNVDEAICALTEKNTEGSRAAALYWIDWRENTAEGRDAEFFIFLKAGCELVE